MKRRVIKNLPESTSGFPDTSVHDIKPESNPFTSADARMLAYAWAGMAVRIFLIAGGIFSVWQYMQQREEHRVERTLSLVQLWDQPSYHEAQRAVRQRLQILNEQHSEMLGENLSDNQLKIYRDRIGLAAMTERGGTMPLDEFVEKFDRVIYLLNRVAFCVEGNLCSKDVANAYFHDYASSFWSYFSAYIESQREEGRPNYGKAIEDYVQKGSA